MFAFKHTLECTSTDGARGYSISFSLQKHYVPVRYPHITVASESSVWVQTWPSCISAATKVVLARGCRVCYCYRLGGSTVQQGSIQQSVLGNKYRFIQQPLGNVFLFSGWSASLKNKHFSKKVFMFITSGKTEYQTTKASKARRSASFERRPSRRYSRRTMQNRGENDTISHYTLLTFISITHLHTQWLESECLLCVVCVYTGQLNAHEWVYNQIWWLWFCGCQKIGCVSKLECLQFCQSNAVTNSLST